MDNRISANSNHNNGVLVDQNGRQESEVQWEKATENLNRPLIINDLDFTELEDNDDSDPLRINLNCSPNLLGPSTVLFQK